MAVVDAAARVDAATWMGEVPEDWDVARLKYVANLGTGHTPSRQNPEYWLDAERTIPWVTLADVWQLRDGGRTTTIHDTAEKITPVGLANSAAVLHPAGTVILSRTASVGFSAILGVDAATSQDFMTWTCGPRLEPMYLLYVLRAMKQEFRRLVMGSTHQTIYMPDIERLTIPLPPLDEQRAIVSGIESEIPGLDAVIERKTQLVLLGRERERAFIARMLHATTPGLDGPLPAGWRAMRVKYAIRSIDQGWSPECDARPAEDAEWGVLKLGCVNGRRFNPSENKALPVGVIPIPTLEVRRGDVLISRGNTRALVAKAAVVEEARPRLMLSDLLYRLRTNPSVIDPKFLALSLGTPRARFHFERDARGSSASMQKVSQASVLNVPIALPDLEEQGKVLARIERKVSAIELLESELHKQLAVLEERRDTLIYDAVTGRPQGD